MTITLKPIGKVDPHILDRLKDEVNRSFGGPVEIKPGIEDIHLAFDPRRKQYSASTLLALLDTSEKGTDEKIVGIADVDVFAEGLNYVFGIADSVSETAMISLKRLRTEFNGLPPDEGKMIQRAVKEVIHELGHTFALVHCSDMKCVMHFSNALADTDWKEAVFCSRCRPRLKI
jgi:archaemetzincin